MTTETDTLIASILCSPEPWSGQEHRCSGDFSTSNAPAGTTQLLFTVDDSNPNFQHLSFDVMEDRSLFPDKTVWTGVADGSTQNFQSWDHLYVANPSDAAGQDFTVYVYASAPSSPEG